MIFPIEFNIKTIQVQLAFQQTSEVANFDFNCEYLENASSYGLLIWYHSMSLQSLRVPKYGLLIGSGSSDSYPKRF